MLKRLTSKLEDEGVETETIHIGGKKVHGCTACGKCAEMKNGQCVFDDDGINECISKMFEADGIVIGSPTYFADVTTETKALIDRAGYVSIANGGSLARKAGAAVIAVRRAGAVHAYDSINHLFGISNMITVGSSYWNLGMGEAPGEVSDDAEGLKTMDNLAANMAWLLKKINSE
jgi:multimeric flavodoxin WrbA